MKKRLSLMLIVIMAFNPIISVGETFDADADSNGTQTAAGYVRTVSLEEAQDAAVAASVAIGAVKTERDQLVNTIADYNDKMEGLNALYEALPAYETLYEKYTFTNSNPRYLQYFLYEQTLAELMAALASETDPMVIAQISAEIAATQTAMTALGLTESEIAGILTVEEALYYQAYAEQFEKVGIADPNLSQKETYETFIEPMYVVPVQMNVGLQTYNLNIEVAENGIRLATEKLYYSVLTLEKTGALAESRRSVSERELYEKRELYRLGKLSKKELDKVENTYQMAVYQAASAERKYESAMMNLKFLMGLSPEEKIALNEPESKEATVETYSAATVPEEVLTSPATNRIETSVLSLQISAKESELGYVADYFSKNSDYYHSVEGELNALNIALKEAQYTIETENVGAYNRVAEAFSDYEAAQFEYTVQVGDWEKVQTYAEQGLVTEFQVMQAELLLSQKKVALDKSRYDWMVSTDQLKFSLETGPGFDSEIGGTNE